MIDLTEIKLKAEELIAKINTSKKLLPSFGEIIDEYPIVRIENQFYKYELYSRGSLVRTKSTENIDELLYWIFESITFNMAVQYELSCRLKQQDCRRIIFEKQRKLMLQISENWHERLSNEQKELLVLYPFHDQ